MHDIDVRAVDLNLLVTLDALLAERSVTRAAARLGVTQPAVSHALGRLREMLGDPLLLRSGREMELTPRAEALAEPLARLLADARRLLAGPGPFEAGTAKRSFSLVCPDLLGPVLPALLGRLRAAAPGVGLAVRLPAGEPALAAATGQGDVALGPPAEGSAPGVRQQRLGVIRWAVLARPGHAALVGGLTVEKWAAYPHVLVRTGSPGANRVGAALERAGVGRRVGVEVPSFLQAPLVVAGTDLLLTAPRALVGPLARALGLVMVEPPVSLPVIPVYAFWSERWHADPGHGWFREQVIAVAVEALAEGERGEPIGAIAEGERSEPAGAGAEGERSEP